MKTFYYTEIEKPAKFGRKIEQRIYKIQKGIPELLTTHEFNTSSCMGNESEAFQGLVNAGILPAKYRHKYSREIPHKLYKM
ncbi:MAG: hypothetical protein AABY22_31025 [Nanoarchaeota archaeon]